MRQLIVSPSPVLQFCKFFQVDHIASFGCRFLSLRDRAGRCPLVPDLHLPWFTGLGGSIWWLSPLFYCSHICTFVDYVLGRLTNSRNVSLGEWKQSVARMSCLSHKV
jgi:hypothetical protein